MERQIATTAEQSARLLQCGVPAESADMHFDMDEERYKVGRFTGIICKLRRPQAWSLSALLGLLFKSGHILSMQYEHNEYRLQSFYSSGDFVTYGLTGIEACVNMIEQLTANGYKLNGIEEGGSEQ